MYRNLRSASFEFWELKYARSDSGDMIEEKLSEFTVFVKRNVQTKMRFEILRFLVPSRAAFYDFFPQHLCYGYPFLLALREKATILENQFYGRLCSPDINVGVVIALRFL